MSNNTLDTGPSAVAHLFGFWDHEEQNGDARSKDNRVTDGADVLDCIQQICGDGVVHSCHVNVVNFIQNVVDIHAEGHEEERDKDVHGVAGGAHAADRGRRHEQPSEVVGKMGAACEELSPVGLLKS